MSLLVALLTFSVWTSTPPLSALGESPDSHVEEDVGRQGEPSTDSTPFDGEEALESPPLSVASAPRLSSTGWSLAGAAAAQEDQTASTETRSAPELSEDEWRFRLSLYGWVPSVTGDTTVRGLSSDVGTSMSEVLESAEFAVFARTTATRGRFYVYGEATYSDVSSEEKVGAVEIDGSLQYGVLDIGAGYAVLQQAIGESKYETLSLSVFGGGRIQYMKGVLDPQGGPRRSRSSDWAEFLVGTKLQMGLSERATAGLSLDFSGFDIGTGSTLTWNLWGALGYRLTPSLGLFAGYRILGLDYSRNSGSEKYGTNMTMNGPIAGLTWDF